MKKGGKMLVSAEVGTPLSRGRGRQKTGEKQRKKQENDETNIVKNRGICKIIVTIICATLPIPFKHREIWHNIEFTFRTLCDTISTFPQIGISPPMTLFRRIDYD